MRLLSVAVLCLVTADAPNPAFDGKSLTGWKGLTSHWKVADDAIVGFHDGNLKANTFLCTEKKFKDFEMSFRVRLKNGAGNSGVQFRSEVIDKSNWAVKGPQADIGGIHWGGLYGEQFGGQMKQADFAKVKTKLKTDDFNDYFLRVVGKKVTINVNGITTVDEEFDKLPAEGIIAIQLHSGPAMEVTLKEIKWKELK